MRKGAFAIAILIAPAVARADGAKDEDNVKVEVRGDANATLQEAVIARYPEIHWEPVCTTPCTVRLRGDSTVRVIGPGFPSEPVKLSREDTILRAQVPREDTTASYALIGSGIVALAYSAVALPVGLGLWFSTSFAFCFGANCPVPDHTTSDALLLSSGASLVAGAVMLSIGVSLEKSARAKLSISSRGASFSIAF